MHCVRRIDQRDEYTTFAGCPKFSNFNQELIMSTKDALVFSPSKVGFNQERLGAYLRGERIYPITMEVDLTQTCTRNCPCCPYGWARQAGLTLPLPFLDRLFGILGPHMPGLVLSGGEPTLTPYFPETVALARKAGIREIAVITNGSRLHDPGVQDALLSGVTSVRVSLYDWEDGESEYFLQTLRYIELLRKRVELEGSAVQIAAALLTDRKRSRRFAQVARAALDSGIHWLYFHPFCVDWDTANPRQADQAGVLEAVQTFQGNLSDPATIQVPYDRYYDRPLSFNELHSAHFLIQVGADGVNYAGPECKYHPDFALLDLNAYLKDDFLWHPKRLFQIKNINSSNYSHIRTRHRAPLFSDYLQRLLDEKPGSGASTSVNSMTFHQPCIL